MRAITAIGKYFNSTTIVSDQTNHASIQVGGEIGRNNIPVVSTLRANYETENLLAKQYIPAPHAMADYVIAQLLTNSIFGTMLFAIFAKYLPIVPTSILEFGRDDLKLGQNTPVVFPLLINAVPLFFAAIEIAIRTCTGSIAKKEDTDVHTPLYKIKPFTRKETVFGFMFLMALQVNNGITNAYPGFEGAVTDEVSRDFFSTSVFAFYGQMIMAMAAYALLTKAIIPIVNQMFPVMKHAAGCVTSCCTPSSSTLGIV